MFNDGGMKIFRKIHLWFSVPFGLIITLVCFSGAMLVFEPELTRCIKSEMYYVSASEGEPIDMKILMETVKASLPDSVSITGVTVFRDKERTYQVNLSKPRRASLFIDQYSGEIKGRYERIPFFATMFRLHRWLLDPPADGVKAGKLAVGISTLFFVIALFTGVVIWWPRARKNLPRSLSVSLKDGWKGLWKSLHVAGGMYALLLLLAMSLTGLTWSFEWYRVAFYKACGVEYTPRRNDTSGRSARRNEPREGMPRGSAEMRGERGGGNENSPEFDRWQQVYDELKADRAGAIQITIAPGSATVKTASSGNVRASDRYEFDHRTGDITSLVRYDDSTGSERLRGWIYSIHTGSLGGVFTRILWFLSALLGASLPLTGYYIWIRRLRKNKNRV